MTKTDAARSDSPQFLTIRQLGARWGCCKMTVHRMMKRGEVPFIKLGKNVRFDLEDVKQVEARGRVNGGAM